MKRFYCARCVECAGWYQAQETTGHISLTVIREISRHFTEHEDHSVLVWIEQRATDGD